MVTRRLSGTGSASGAAPRKAAADNTSAAAAGATKRSGDAAEDHALQWLLSRGLTLVQRNYRVARGPSAPGGEIDLVMREADGTLVFVEVRARASGSHGGAAASIGRSKQLRLVRAAQHYLMRLPQLPPCRFDVLALDGDLPGARIEWLRGAFDAG